MQKKKKSLAKPEAYEWKRKVFTYVIDDVFYVGIIKTSYSLYIIQHSVIRFSTLVYASS